MITFWPIPKAGTINKLIPSFARAIAKAEGYGIVGDIPTRANNPGDLVLGDMGLGTLGSAGITVFQSFSVGAYALYHELDLIFTDRSGVYNTQMTITQMARLWTGGDNAIGWASTVAKALNVLPDTRIASFLTRGSTWQELHGTWKDL